MSRHAVGSSCVALFTLIAFTACTSAPPRAPAPPPLEPVVSEPAAAEPPQPIPAEPVAADPLLEKPAAPAAVVVPEAWETVRRPEENVDSVAVWPGRGARPWLLATAEATDRLLVFDAGSGEPLRDFGGSGDAAGRFRRPHGIAVAGDLAFVVERDNARVQVLRLPGLSTVGFVGVGELANPYGIAVVAGGGGYDLYVSDDGEPGAAEPDRRVRHYRVAVATDGLAAERVAEEEAARGEWQEGAALYPCSDGGGYWVAADQADARTQFLVLERETLEEVGRFTGEVTVSIGGLSMWSGESEEFPQGVFYAVYGGRSVAAFDWGEVMARLGLRGCV